MKKQNQDNFKISRKEISIDGKKLPLAIGDIIKMGENDQLVKTVMGIQVNEDERVNYCLEWYDQSDCSFKNEWLTFSELKLLQNNVPKHKTIMING